MEINHQILIQFNMPVTTPDGQGYLVARDEDGKFLVCLPRKEAGKSPCRHLWYRSDQVEELKNLCQPSMT